MRQRAGLGDEVEGGGSASEVLLTAARYGRCNSMHCSCSASLANACCHCWAASALLSRAAICLALGFVCMKHILMHGWRANLSDVN